MQPQQDEMWTSVRTLLPKEGQPVMTKIDDEDGCRNVTTLKRLGRLWFFEDGSMYVYYNPTHWKPK
jgi:hypothetical protein